MVAIALTGICAGQLSEEQLQKRFEAEITKSERLAVTYYPDTTNSESAMMKRMVELDTQMRQQGDPRYHSPEKPMILAELAAKELGINPVGSKPSPEGPPTAGEAGLPAAASTVAEAGLPEGPPPVAEPGLPVATSNLPNGTRDANWIAQKERAWEIMFDEFPEYTTKRNSLKNTYIWIQQWDAWAKENEPTLYNNPMKPLIYARRQKAADKEDAARQAEAERIAAAEYQQVLRRPVVWKRYVKNAGFQEANKEAIAQEIRSMDGNEAAERFLSDQNEKEGQEAGNAVNELPRTQTLEGGKYQKRGDRIMVNGDSSGGYQIRGKKLYSSSGTPTHTRSGSMWMPLISGQKQIYDP